MSHFYVVVENLKDWQPYYPTPDVITFDDYLQRVKESSKKRIRVINLCRDYRYLKTGYYCSLLAEARNHHVLPSVTTINNLGNKSLSKLLLDNTQKAMSSLPKGEEGETKTFRCWFGKTGEKSTAKLAQLIFEKLPSPLLEITLTFKHQWQIKQIKPLALKSLTDPAEQEAFAQAFEQFSLQLWRKPKARKQYRYDMAILTNPDDPLPPSDPQALAQFVKAANSLGISTEFITKKDYVRLAEFDALFIRETTSVDHHTYKFAKKAEAEGLVVIDDPTSILRCTNKVYLADLLSNHKVPTPKTLILSQATESNLKELATEIGFPMVLKIPDGSFSRGVIKVKDEQELEVEAKRLLAESSLLLAQEYMYTEYDWRIGVFNNKPLYASRYYMVQGHWQIYNHGEGETESGNFDTLPTYEAPKKVIDVALKATKLIGDGFYGVDLKQSGDRVVVIEVNDNPSIDSGVEDLFLGEQLYLEIMKEILRRLEEQGK
ncbi:MAG: RimK family protein [Thiotrichales bacterium]|jgi:glutathione synthase/RimK-type ligase-like ATP-grasp enzyme|nr:RimK family protein [Thiotrichales bacterium]